jgi:hypothetical protein
MLARGNFRRWFLQSEGRGAAAVMLGRMAALLAQLHRIPDRADPRKSQAADREIDDFMTVPRSRPG